MSRSGISSPDEADEFLVVLLSPKVDTHFTSHGEQKDKLTPVTMHGAARRFQGRTYGNAENTGVELLGGVCRGGKCKDYQVH